MERNVYAAVFINIFLMIVAGQDTSYLYVRKGDSVTLECRFPVERMYVTWLGPPNLKHYFSGNEISEDLTSIRIAGNERNNEHFLQISNFSDTYIGTYECYAFNQTKHWFFEVILRSNPTYLRIINAINNNEIFSVENKEVILECKVNAGQPKGYLQWKSGSTVLTKGQNDTLLYKFTPRRSYDRPSYTCQALNDAKETVLEKTVYVFVFHKPNVTVLGYPLQYITEGQDLNLICKHDSNDENATITWLSNVLPFPGHAGNSLVIRHVSRNQSGNYICEVKSRGGTGSKIVNIVVQYAPDVSIIEQETTTSKILVCKATGIPDEYLFEPWEHTSFRGDHIRYITGKIDRQLVMPLAIVGSKEFFEKIGIYRCSVSNGILDTRGNRYQISSKELTFAGKPLFLNGVGGPELRRHGTEISAEMYVYSYPRYNGTRLANANRGRYIKSHPYVLETSQTMTTIAIYGKKFVIPAFKITITFQNTTGTDIGDVTFVVENEYGSTNLTFNIKSAAFQDHSIDKSSNVIAYAVLALVLILIIGILAFLRLTEKGRQLKSSCVEKIRGSENDEVHVAGGVAIENEVYGIGNNMAVDADRTPPVYSSIDRRANLSIAQTVSYSVTTKKQESSKNRKEKKRDDNGNGNDKTASPKQVSSSKDTPELNYVDVCFDPKPRDHKFKIHGSENKTPYAEVDFSQSINRTSPSSESEEDSDEDFANIDEVNKMKRKTRCA